MSVTYECAYCGQEFPKNRMVYNYTLKARICEKCKDEIHKRDKKK